MGTCVGVDRGTLVGTQLVAEGGLTWDLNVLGVGTARSSAEREKESTKRGSAGEWGLCGRSWKDLERARTLNRYKHRWELLRSQLGRETNCLQCSLLCQVLWVFISNVNSLYHGSRGGRHTPDSVLCRSSERMT